MHPARVWGEWIPQLPEEYPAIEGLVRMVPFKKGIVQIGEQRFYSDHLFKADSSFFDMYDFKLLSGKTDEVLHKPNEAVLSRSLALKYFGNLDVLGKQLEITHQQQDSAVAYTIVGVMEDFPASSHFHAEVLTTIPDMELNSSWGYTYYLVKEGTDMEALRSSIQQKWDEELEEGQIPKQIHFQKLTDIHLYSHKTREIESNGDIRSLILLVSGAVIILFIALINFLNLSRVQFIADTKSIKIKMINGATRNRIAREIATESLVISLTAILLGLFLSHKLSAYLHTDPFSSYLAVILISLVFILCIAFLSVYPLLSSRIVSDTRVSRSSAGLYTFPLVLQFTLAVIAITGTIVLQRQIKFLNDQHPQATNANIVVIERNPWTVVQRYDRFKGELLNDPSIVSMTGAMEEPGGDVLDNFQFEMEGIEPDESRTLYILTTDSNFFTAMGIKPLAGTVNLGYTPGQEWESNAVELSMLLQDENGSQERADELYEKIRDYREKYILNESALKMLGIDDPQDAIGRSFRLHFQLPFLFPEGTVVGVVPDFHYTNLHNQERPMVIAPRKMFNYNFLIQIDPERRSEALAAINKSWNTINPEFPLEYSYITDAYQKVYATEYAQSKVLSLFALISILLSALGIYAIAAFSMQRRVKEIGIRKVNGATVSEIIMMLNRKFILWVTIAFVVAVPIAWYAMHRWLENFAYKTELSWWIFALAGLIAMTVAMITVTLRSYRAATRNPVESLRYE
tara:strand:- start:6641 stop:8869 length:2229 start_codon:yes stop_codon:yes gene_type:complete